MKNRPFKIYVQNEIVVRFGDVPEIGAAFDPSIVDEHVDFAELFGGFFDEALAVGDFGNVRLNSDRFRPVGT